MFIVADLPLPFRYIVYDADWVDFWLGLKADLTCEESDMSWESVLLNRWPNLKAVIAKTRAVTENAKCPFYQVWISSRNAINVNDPPTDNPLDRMCRLIYGKTLSGVAKPTTGRKENNSSFKTNYAIPFDPASVESSRITDPGSEDSPFTFLSEATRITDGQLYGFDFFTSSDASELHNSPTFIQVERQVERIAFLFSLARIALPSERWSMDIAVTHSLHVLCWLVVVSESRKTGI
jgi:hypothetical protein